MRRRGIGSRAGGLLLAGAITAMGCSDGKGPAAPLPGETTPAAGGGQTGRDPARPPGTNPGPVGQAPAEGPRPGAMAAGCAAGPVAAPARLRMLTNLEYANSVGDLLGVRSPTLDDLPPRLTKEGFDNDVELVATSVSAAGIAAYARTAEDLATAAIARQEAWLPAGCKAHDGDASCFDRFLSPFLARAFRRPPSAREVEIFTGVFQKVRAVGSWDDALGAAVEAVLQSPQLLYLTEQGVPGATGTPGVVKLGGYERAARLAFFLTAAPPDEPLRAAAGRGELDSPQAIEAHARRLLGTPRARSGFRNLYGQWLELDEVDTLARDPKTYPKLTPAARDAAREEIERFTDWVTWDEKGGVAALLTSPVTFVNGPLAAFYGTAKPPAPDQWTRVTLDARQRPGVLTRLGWIAAHAHADQTSPILRGVAVLTRFMCQPPPPPPPAVVTKAPDVDLSASTRKRFEQHRDDPQCAGCHALFDPIGFGFETYDAAGVWRTSEGPGLPVDASGTIKGAEDPSLNGPFNGAAELVQRLAGSPQVAACAARQVLRYALARFEEEGDACSLAQLRARVGERASFQDLLVAMTQTDAFLYVRSDSPRGAP